MKKGVADMVAAILLILLVLYFLISYITTINNEMQKQIVMNLHESEVQRLSNTFNLLNRSLGMTWYISMVQTVYNTADQSMRCGLLYTGVGAIPVGYKPRNSANTPDAKFIYQYNPEQPKDLAAAKKFIADRGSGQGNGYNQNQPAICYPNDIDVVTMITNYFMDVYKSIPAKFQVNGMAAALSGLNDDKSTSITFDSAGVWSNSKQQIDLKSSNANINEQTSNENQMYTEFPKMVSFSRTLATFFVGLADGFAANGAAFNPSLRYQDLNVAIISQSLLPDSAASYLDRMQNTALDTSIKLQGKAAFTRTNVEISKTQYELFAAPKKDAPVFGRDESSFSDSGGLILHYNYTISMTERGALGSTSACSGGSQLLYLNTIKNEVADPNKEWKFSQSALSNKFEFTNDEIVTFVSAIIQTEDPSWNPKAIDNAGCGAVGLGQLMAGTALQNGISKVLEPVPTKSSSCDRDYYDRLVQLRDTQPESVLFSTDERFDAPKNIRASVNYIYSLMRSASLFASDKEELLKMTAAAYNTGLDHLQQAINSAAAAKGVPMDQINFDDALPYLLQETQNYVPKVMGNYICFGGFVAASGDLYLYHNESENTFVKRPVTMQVKAEDYLPAIDCSQQIYNNAPGLTDNEKDFYNTIRFFSWQHSPAPIAATILAGAPGQGRLTITQKIMLSGDLACCVGKMYSCDASVPGLASSNALASGGSVDCGSTMTCGNDPNCIQQSHVLQCNAGIFSFSG